MNIHLDALLNLPGVTVETCTTQEQAIYLRLEVLKDTGECPHCDDSNYHQKAGKTVLNQELAV